MLQESLLVDASQLTSHFGGGESAMSVSLVQEIDISVGAESQVAVATTLTSTTAEARYRFSPLERGCYFEGELQGWRWSNRIMAKNATDLHCF